MKSKAFALYLFTFVTAGILSTAASQTGSAADQVIKIGALLPMSGPGSYFGAQDKQGIELALEQLNKAGVNGYKFEVQYEDWRAVRCRRRRPLSASSTSSNPTW